MFLSSASVAPSSGARAHAAPHYSATMDALSSMQPYWVRASWRKTEEQEWKVLLSRCRQWLKSMSTNHRADCLKSREHTPNWLEVLYFTNKLTSIIPLRHYNSQLHAFVSVPLRHGDLGTSWHLVCQCTKCICLFWTITSPYSICL